MDVDSAAGIRDGMDLAVTRGEGGDPFSSRSLSSEGLVCPREVDKKIAFNWAPLQENQSLKSLKV